MEPEYLLPFPELYQCSPLLFLFLEGQFQYYTPVYSYVFRVISLSHVPPPKTSPFLHTRYMPRPSHYAQFYP